MGAQFYPPANVDTMWRGVPGRGGDALGFAGADALGDPVTGHYEDAEAVHAVPEVQRRRSVPRDARTGGIEPEFDIPAGTETRTPSKSTTFTLRDWGPSFNVEVSSGAHGVIERNAHTQEGEQSPQGVYPNRPITRQSPSSWDDPLHIDAQAPSLHELR